jgi:hypothetical protein
MEPISFSILMYVGGCTVVFGGYKIYKKCKKIRNKRLERQAYEEKLDELRRPFF